MDCQVAGTPPDSRNQCSSHDSSFSLRCLSSCPCWPQSRCRSSISRKRLRATSLDEVLITVNHMLQAAVPGQMSEQGEEDYEELEEEAAREKARKETVKVKFKAR